MKFYPINSTKKFILHRLSRPKIQLVIEKLEGPSHPSKKFRTLMLLMNNIHPQIPIKSKSETIQCITENKERN